MCQVSYLLASYIYLSVLYAALARKKGSCQLSESNFIVYIVMTRIRPPMGQLNCKIRHIYIVCRQIKTIQ